MKAIYILFSMLLLIVTACTSKKSDNQLKTEINSHKKVEVHKVFSKQMVEQYSYTGLINAKQDIPLSFLLPGKVKEVFVNEGDKVEAGQLLATIDAATTTATYAAAVATQKQVTDAYNRLQTVYNKGSLPEIEWEDIKTKLEQANASAEIARLNVDKTTIVAPSSGIIGTRNIEVGASVSPIVTAFNLLTIREVYVKISVPENEINAYKKGQIAHINVGALGNKQFKAKVDKIGVVANQISKTYEINLLLDNSDMLIKPGMVCDVSFNTLATHSVIGVASQAVMQDLNHKSYVFVVDPNTSIVSKRFVEVGDLLSHEIQLNSGLQIGELVVVHGQHKLQHSDTVSY